MAPYYEPYGPLSQSAGFILRLVFGLRVGQTNETLLYFIDDVKIIE